MTMEREIERAVAEGEKAGEWAEHELLSLRRTFRERRIDLASMDPPLRWATIGAGLALLGTACLILLRDVPATSVTLLPTDGVTTTLSLPLFVATIALLAVGLGYVTAGAVLAHRIAAFLAMLTLTAALSYATGVLGFGVRLPLPGWAVAVTRGLLAALWLLAVAVTLIRRGRHGDAAEDRTARLVLLLVCCGLYGGYFVVLAVAIPSVGGLSLFPGVMSVLMDSLPIVTVPILTVAAIDFGEWGELAGRRLHDLVHPHAERRPTAFVAPLACCLGLLLLAWFAQHGSPGHRLAHLGEGAGLFALFAAVLFGIGRLVRACRQNWPESLNFAGLFAVMAVNVWLIAIVTSWLLGDIKATPTPAVRDGQFTAAAAVRTLSGAGGSTLLLPDGWLDTAISGQHVYSDTDPHDGELKLLVGTLPPGTPIQIVVAGARLGPAKGPVTVDGQLQQVLLTPSPPLRSAAIWLYPGSTSTYFLVGEQTGGGAGDGGVQQLTAIARSFRPPGVPPAQPPHDSEATTPEQAAQATADREQVLGDAIALALSAIGLALLAGPGRRWPGRVRLTILAFAAVTLASLWYFADSFGRVLAGRTAGWPALSTAGLLAGLGALGLLALAVSTRSDRPWARRLPASLAGLLAAVLALRGMELLYDRALSASRVAGWGVVVILVAVAWDVTMSGESMTNHASALVPRASRVLLFLGYGIVLDAAALFFSGQKLQGNGAAVTEVFFEPDAVTQSGLFRLALPVLIVLFGLHTFGTAPEEAD